MEARHEGKEVANMSFVLDEDKLHHSGSSLAAAAAGPPGVFAGGEGERRRVRKGEGGKGLPAGSDAAGWWPLYTPCGVFLWHGRRSCSRAQGHVTLWLTTLTMPAIRPTSSLFASLALRRPNLIHLLVRSRILAQAGSEAEAAP
jgi:hypothetical protein